jgi:hypothetical protein
MEYDVVGFGIKLSLRVTWSPYLVYKVGAEFSLGAGYSTFTVALRVVESYEKGTPPPLGV